GSTGFEARLEVELGGPAPVGLGQRWRQRGGLLMEAAGASRQRADRPVGGRVAGGSGGMVAGVLRMKQLSSDRTSPLAGFRRTPGAVRAVGSTGGTGRLRLGRSGP